MKTIVTAAVFGFLVFGIYGKLNGQNVSGLNSATVEKQVDSIFQSMVKAAEDLNYDKLSEGVSDRYNAGFIINNIFYSRYDSLISTVKANLPAGVKQTISLQKKKITALSDKIVLVTASGDSKVHLNTEQSFEVKFFWSFVYERFNSGWKVIHSHQSQVN